MADKKPFVNYSGELKEIAVSDTIAVANGGVDQLAWTSFTPTLANITLGNGTVVCRYKLLSKKTLVFTFQITAGSTTTLASGVLHTLTLPLLAEASKALHSSLGELIIYDSSASLYYTGGIMLETNSGTATASLFTEYANTTYTYLGAFQAGVPITLASGDILSSTFIYETA
jgi:hypothetical protein